MKPFPTIVLGVFIGLALISVLIFSTFSGGQKNRVGAVTIWGPIPDSEMIDIKDTLQKDNDAFDNVSYQYVPREDLVPRLVTAIAGGKGPDLVLLPASYLISQSDKLQTIPYDSLSRRKFQDSYIEAAEILLESNGMKGLPFSVDPLVMYWNRSLFSVAGIAQTPQYWDELAEDAAILSKADERGTLLQSAVALGSWQNVDYAKGVFASILRQLGNTALEKRSDGYHVVFLNGATQGSSPAATALRYFTDFSDPVKPVYSWNRSQPESRSAFVSGKLAIYFGRASELAAIRASNPNLNFDVARIPAIRGGGSQVESDLLFLAIPRGAKNVSGATTIAGALTAANAQEVVTGFLHLPSVRRDALSDPSSDQYLGIFRSSALSAFVFPDPEPSSSNSVFERMVEGVTSGNLTVSEAISSAHQELSALLGAR